MVIEPGIPACSMIWASRSCCLAFSTSCFMLALFSMLEINSEFSTDVVPTKTGCSLLTQSLISSVIARYFSLAVK
ncbi:hypothetical protein BMETH_1015_1 [methanotrophic bacterial endosymbiont of Bathymodiolus sp.]|nr:hypothetical protein BMETH_1015_1 [methanotrophic bacterial endosymbiont of Bathymodiolus sp.]